MTQEELNEVLKQHKVWLDSDGKEGKRADLRYADLTLLDLSDADLRRSDFSYSDLKFTGLYNTDFRDAELKGVNLKYTDIRFVKLEGTGIRYINGPKHSAIYNSKDNTIRIGCMIHSLEYWLENYVTIGKKNGYSKEEIKTYGKWFKSLKGI